MSSRIAVIGTRRPTEETAGLCRKISAAFRDAGWELVAGNAQGIDSIARDVWNETCPERVTLVLPWAGYLRDRIHPANKVLIFDGQPDWLESVRLYHPAHERLSETETKLHARNYGIIFCSDVVVAFPKDGKGSGGTGQGIRVARALGKRLFILPEDLEMLRRYYVNRRIADELAETMERGELDVSLLPEDVRLRLLKALAGTEEKT
jgi:hypothetical protein